MAQLPAPRERMPLARRGPLSLGSECLHGIPLSAFNFLRPACISQLESQWPLELSSHGTQTRRQDLRGPNPNPTGLFPLLQALHCIRPTSSPGLGGFSALSSPCLREGVSALSSLPLNLAALALEASPWVHPGTVGCAGFRVGHLFLSSAALCPIGCRG